MIPAMLGGPPWIYTPTWHASFPLPRSFSSFPVLPRRRSVAIAACVIFMIACGRLYGGWEGLCSGGIIGAWPVSDRILR